MGQPITEDDAALVGESISKNSKTVILEVTFTCVTAYFLFNIFMVNLI